MEDKSKNTSKNGVLLGIVDDGWQHFVELMKDDSLASNDNTNIDRNNPQFGPYTNYPLVDPVGLVPEIPPGDASSSALYRPGTLKMDPYIPGTQENFSPRSMDAPVMTMVTPSSELGTGDYHSHSSLLENISQIHYDPLKWTHSAFNPYGNAHGNRIMSQANQINQSWVGYSETFLSDTTRQQSSVPEVYETHHMRPEIGGTLHDGMLGSVSTLTAEYPAMYTFGKLSDIAPYTLQVKNRAKKNAPRPSSKNNVNLPRDKKGYAIPEHVQNLLDSRKGPYLPTILLEEKCFPQHDAHIPLHDGIFCQVRGKISNSHPSVWDHSDVPCGTYLKSMDNYRRHLLEKHLNQRRKKRGLKLERETMEREGLNPA
jgi:hypothetical protein